MRLRLETAWERDQVFVKFIDERDPADFLHIGIAYRSRWQTKAYQVRAFRFFMQREAAQNWLYRHGGPHPREVTVRNLRQLLRQAWVKYPPEPGNWKDFYDRKVAREEAIAKYERQRRQEQLATEARDRMAAERGERIRIANEERDVIQRKAQQTWDKHQLKQRADRDARAARWLQMGVPAVIAELQVSYERQHEIRRMRDVAGMTFEAIGERVHLSAQRVRQIYHSSKKYRTPPVMKWLAERESDDLRHLAQMPMRRAIPWQAEYWP